MTVLETMIARLDGRPFDIAWRTLLGFSMLPAIQSIAGSRDDVMAHSLLLLLLLAGVRITLALSRAGLPFSTEIRAIWKKRRFLAKEYDSYQWQKLLWIGLGMLPHAAMRGGDLGNGGWLLIAFCLIGGGAGLLTWWRVGSRQGPSLQPSAKSAPPVPSQTSAVP